STTGRFPIRFIGQGSDDPATWLAAEPVTLTNLTVTGFADRAALSIRRYASVDWITLSGVDLSGMMNTAPPGTPDAVTGLLLEHAGEQPLDLADSGLACQGPGYYAVALRGPGGAHATCATTFG